MIRARSIFISLGIVLKLLLQVSLVILINSPLLINSALAQNAMLSRPAGFSVPEGLRGKVEFWKQIFTKYTDTQYVFHHREHPEIIYSVVDVTQDFRSLSPKAFEKQSALKVKEEYARIKEQLSYLAEGNPPRSGQERRLSHLFGTLPGGTRANYRDAMDENQIRYQRGIRERFREGLIRSGRYLPAMEKVFLEEGLPVELTRLPLIESSFDYTAYSSVGAAGIWQFMRGTGRKYLRIDGQIDQRRDPIFATRAAARYLSHAYDRLGTWPLAVTSYNHGVAGIARAVATAGSQDLVEIIREYESESFGFASKNFYAEFLAAVDIERNANRYFPGIVSEEHWHFDEVRLGRAMGYQDLVRASGVSEEEIEQLNRSFMKGIVGGRARIPAGVSVMLPFSAGSRLVANVPGSFLVSSFGEGNLVKHRDGGAGERDEAVKKMALSPRSKLPSAQAKEYKKEKQVVAAKSAETERAFYVVKPGDTLGKIAKAKNMSLKKLQSLNPGIDKTIKPGQRINVN